MGLQKFEGITHVRPFIALGILTEDFQTPLGITYLAQAGASVKFIKKRPETFQKIKILRAILRVEMILVTVWIDQGGN